MNDTGFIIIDQFPHGSSCFLMHITVIAHDGIVGQN